MTGNPLIALAFASLRNRAGTVALTILTIALSTMLFLGVEKIRTGAKAGFEATVSGTDLIVGARSAPVNLLLASVFRIGNTQANMSWEAAEAIAARDDVAWTVPLSLGDSHRGERVLGTVPAYFEHYKYGDSASLQLAKGDVFADLFDVVLGAQTARLLGYDLGDEIELTHGLGQAGISDHAHLPFRIVGILAPTGTPVDRTVHVSLQAIEAIHIGWETGAPSRIAQALSPEERAVLAGSPESISALLVGLTDRASILRTKRAIDTYPDEALLAVLPGQAMGELWAITGMAERALLAVSIFVVLVGLVSALAMLLSGLSERRREMAILRAVGARPAEIGSLLIVEALIIAALGAILGAIVLQIMLMLGAPALANRWGVVLLGTGPGLIDLGAIVLVTLSAGVMGLVPAVMTYRRALADGLNVKL